MVESPCTRYCLLDRELEVCVGCFRTREEIRAWPGLGAQQQSELVEILGKRKISLAGLLNRRSDKKAY